MKHQLKVGTLIGMVICLGIIIFLFCFWGLEGVLFHKVFNQDQITLQTTKEIYHRGEKVQGYFTGCKNNSVIPSVQWSIIDTYLRTYPLKQGFIDPPKCYTQTLVDVEIIADSLPDDTYYFSGTATYNINPIKTIVVPLVTNKFVVK